MGALCACAPTRPVYPQFADVVIAKAVLSKKEVFPEMKNPVFQSRPILCSVVST
jgi:hypothetical protein